MKILSILFFFLLTISVNCQTNQKDKDYVLVNENGVSVEKFDSTNVDQNRFTKNNIVFREGTVFRYKFEHITQTNQKFLFNEDNSIEDRKFAWKFVPMDSVNENTVTSIKITVMPGLEPMIQGIPDYNQTILKYECHAEKGKAFSNSMSGVIENENNIWMHPPRDKYFRILELNPFPFIKAPYEIGNEWEWTLGIGSGWGDVRWKVWEGRIENKYKYKITDKKKIKTALGDIDCFVIESTAISSIGKTKLTSFFNPEYGFIKLNYTNIDGSKTNLELIEHSKKASGQ